MSIFNTIREYLGTDETIDIVIHDEDDNVLTEPQLIARRVEALTETVSKGEQSLIDLIASFDETDGEYDLKLQACEIVLSKGENQDVTLNKEVLTEKRQRNFDKFLKDATRLKTKLDLQKAELEELEKGGAGSGRHKNLSHYTSNSYKDYKYGNPHQAATEIMQHQDELAAHHEKAKQTAGDFNSPGLSHAFHADVKAIHEGSKLGVAKHLQEYHKHSGEDNEYRGSKKASSELIEHVKDYHNKFNESAKKAGGFIEPGVRHAAKQDFHKAEDIELFDWFFNEDTDLEEFMEKATDLVSKATDEQQASVGEFMKAWQKGGQVVDQREAITAALTVSGLVQKKTEDLTKAEDYTGHYANVLLKDKDGKLLLLKRVDSKVIEPGKYCPPGGHIDEGETIAQAAARELKEEANLIVKPEDLFFSCKSLCGDGKWAFYLSAPTYNEEMGLLAVLDGESDNAGWYSQDEWLELDLIFDLKNQLLQVYGQDVENVHVIKGEEEIELTDEELEELTKGGKPKVGEKKSFGGKDYSRTEKGWKAKKSKGHTGHTAEQLAAHAQSTSDIQLRKVTKNKTVHISLRDSARHELSTREKTSKVDKVSDLLTQIENKAKKEKLGVKDLVGQLREHLESEQKEKDKNKKVVEKP